MNGGGGVAAEVHHGGRRRRGPDGRGWGRQRDTVVLLLLLLRGAGGDAILGQELLQVHVLQLEAVAIVGQRLVPQGGPQEGRMRGAAPLVQLVLLVAIFDKH